jgi:hypothetical protein
MLLAENNGHVVPEATDSEDYLTSAVFGHLRYLRPSIFWEEFLSPAVGLPVANHESFLLDVLASRQLRLRDYSSLDVQFWPTHSTLGTPDLLLCFSGSGIDPFVLIIEAKLWSGKSGTGEKDQLFRYLQILENLDDLDLPLPSARLRSAVACLLYLTPRESLPELRDTVNVCGDSRLWRRLFRAQWQDIVLAAEASYQEADQPAGMILRDVSTFLKVRNLEYFRGFTPTPNLNIGKTDGSFYGVVGQFDGFSEMPLPSMDLSTGLFFSPL